MSSTSLKTRAAGHHRTHVLPKAPFVVRAKLTVVRGVYVEGSFYYRPLVLGWGCPQHPGPLRMWLCNSGINITSEPLNPL